MDVRGSTKHVHQPGQKPVHVYSGVSPIAFNGAYSQERDLFSDGISFCKLHLMLLSQETSHRLNLRGGFELGSFSVGVQLGRGIFLKSRGTRPVELYIFKSCLFNLWLRQRQES